MAKDDDQNIGDLGQIKQLTSSIRFENEDVRRQVEAMLGRYREVADILDKTRELTHAEAILAKDYLATVSRIAAPMEEHVKGLTAASKTLFVMEKAAKGYVEQAEKATRVSEKLSQSIKNARKEKGLREERLAPGEKRVSEADASLKAIQEHRAGLERGGIKAPRQIEMQLVKEEAAKKRLLDVAQKSLGADKAGIALADKRIKSLQTQKKMAEAIASRSEGKAKTALAFHAGNEKLLPDIQKRKLGQAEPGAGGEEGEGGRGARAGGYGYRQRHGLMGSLGLNVLSDVGIPGISEVARVERYRRMASESASRFRAQREEEGGGAGGGMLGSMAGMLASPMGIAMGGLAVAGGIGVRKFGQAMGEAEGMAGPQRVLEGQVGKSGLGAANASYRQDLTDFGLDIRQAQSALVGLNRSLGGSAGSQLRGAAGLGNAFGQDVGEIGGQAGSLLRAGGASPGTAVKSLEKIMIEGVRAGMDKARITEFTSEVISLQEQVLRETGQNNASSIAKSLAQLMGASGKQGQEFFQGAAFQGVKGIDSALKGFARGSSGPGAGTLYRTLSEQAKGDTPGDRYVNMMERAEGGIFGGKSPGDSINLLKGVVGHYFQESGAGDLFDKKAKMKPGEKLGPDDQRRFQSAENVVRTRMQMDMGVGFNQSKELIKLLENIDRKTASPEGQKAVEGLLRDMRDKTKDPLVALGEKMGKANVSLQQISLNTSTLKAFGNIKDIETSINRGYAPGIEAGAAAFNAAVTRFGAAVDGFSGVHPELGPQIDPGKGPSSGVGSSLGETDWSLMSLGSMAADAVSSAIKGLSLGSSAAPPPASSPASPQMPKAGASVQAPSSDLSQATLRALLEINQSIQANTVVTAQGITAQRTGRVGNVGGAAGRQ